MASPLRPVCPAPRITWACEGCRSRKSRCLPSTQGGICERCLATRSTCVFPSRVPGTKGALTNKNSKSSSVKNAQAVLSQKATMNCDNILAGLFATSKTETAGRANALAELQSFHREALGRLLPNMPWLSSDGRGSSDLDTRSVPKRAPNTMSMPPKLSINPRQAQNYLNRYGSLFAYFPFIILPLGWTLQSMLKDCPFLVLGILTAMSQGDGHLHFQLDAEFRKVMSEKITMNGEKSLDLLQGLLVHIAWYPQHLKPRISQLRQFLQIAISLLTDLKYHLPPGEGEPVDCGNDTSKRDEEIRAYLGCYYLAAAIEAPSKRFHPLDFTNYTEFCIGQVAANPTCEADRILVPLVMLQTSCQEATKANPYETSYNLESTRSPLDTCIDSCRHRLLPFLGRVTSSSQTYAPVNLLRLYADTKLYAIALMPDLGSTNSSQLSEARLNALTSCLQTIKATFDTILSLPLSEYQNFSISEWIRFIHSVIILFQICRVTITTPGRRFGPSDPRKQFGLYFESLSFRMGELAVAEDATAPPNVFCMFKAVLPLVRQLYEGLVEKLPGETSPTDNAHTGAPAPSILHCPMFGRHITQTDYWEMLGETANMYAETHNTRTSSEGFDLISQLGDWETWENGFQISNDFTEFDTSTSQV